MSTDKPQYDKIRSSPRARAALEVLVEVAGEQRKVLLVSQDIGAGGLYLRTVEPAPLWKKVRLLINLPDGGEFEVGGEVVRSVSLEQAREKGHATGFAVAFDEVSRRKRKELVAVVLELCAKRPSREERQEASRLREAPDEGPVGSPAPAQVVAPPPVASDEFPREKTDDLLDQLDDMLDNVEGDGLEASSNTTAEQELKRAQDPDQGQAALDDIEIDIGDVAVAAEPESAPDPQSASDGQIDAMSAALADYKKNRTGDTHYHVLGVDLKASGDQIKAAYQELLVRFKPPGSPDEMPAAVVKDLSGVLGRIRKAFAILAKSDRKKAYDFLIDNSDEFP